MTSVPSPLLTHGLGAGLTRTKTVAVWANLFNDVEVGLTDWWRGCPRPAAERERERESLRGYPPEINSLWEVLKGARKRKREKEGAADCLADLRGRSKLRY